MSMDREVTTGVETGDVQYNASAADHEEIIGADTTDVMYNVAIAGGEVTTGVVSSNVQYNAAAATVKVQPVCSFAVDSPQDHVVRDTSLPLGGERASMFTAMIQFSTLKASATMATTNEV
jgi:hypothetical protein